VFSFSVDILSSSFQLCQCVLSSCVLTNFRLLQWFIVDVDSALGILHHVDVGSAANISEVHAASRFRIEVTRVSKCY
jgi:hypothetical protein